jgi:cytochrome c553
MACTCGLAPSVVVPSPTGGVPEPATATMPVVLNNWPDMPLWAFGVSAVPAPRDKPKPQPPRGRNFDPTIDRQVQLAPLHLYGSPRRYSLYDLSDWGNAADWFPSEHPPPPRVVQHGPARLGTQTCACAYCHKTTGAGRPDNAPVAGLPVDYFLRQLDDFRTGRRLSSDPRKSNTLTMIQLAQAISKDEALAAAKYYAGRSGGPHVRVIETDRAPPTHLEGNRFVASGSERTEPLVDQILEVAVDPEQSEKLDNPHFGYIANVPSGSIVRGQRLVRGDTTSETSAEGGIQRCASCHGVDLRGLPDAPPIAGRSPSYLVRQLYDFKTHARRGAGSASMAPVAGELTAAQMADIAAYLATLPRDDSDLK